MWFIVLDYRGAEKSLARPGKKQATFLAFYGTWRFITLLTTVHHLSLPCPNQSIPLPITLLTGAACFLPDRAKDFSAPRYDLKSNAALWSAVCASPVRHTEALKLQNSKTIPNACSDFSFPTALSSSHLNLVPASNICLPEGRLEHCQGSFRAVNFMSLPIMTVVSRITALNSSSCPVW